jgi:hypothetical protein
MAEKTNRAAEVHRELAALVKPLREQVGKLDSEIAVTEAELQSLRAARREAARALSILDPQPAEPKPRAKRTKGGAPGGIAPATLQAITGWLQEHKDELNGDGGFRARVTAERDDFTICSRATFDKAIPVLREQGVLVLDHVGGIGGVRHYKVT